MTAERPINSESSMHKPEAMQLLEARFSRGNFVCVGLDSELEKIPSHIRERFESVSDIIFEFNKPIIDATADFACGFKPNSAFYERQGEEGENALKRTVHYIKKEYPEIPVILDGKRGDIGNTNLGYIEHAFDLIGADFVTVNPLLGKEALKPFLDRRDKGIIPIVKTSNPGSGEFQDLYVSRESRSIDMMRLYEYMADRIASEWNENGNCAIVVGATYPEELEKIREIVGDLPILIPGIGAQGGDVEKTVKAGRDSRNMGMIINSSRGIIFASSGEDFAEAARREAEKLSATINEYRAA